MNLVDACELLKKYAVCPRCGCDTVGGGTGTWECDTRIGYFKRTCRCGWAVEVNEETCNNG